MRRADTIHLGLMLAALGLAYVLPFELLVLSYAFLGPAHYLTEISWLHDRGYFVPNRGIALVLAGLALAAMFTSQPFWYGVIVWSALIAAALAATVTAPQYRFAALLLAAGATLLLALSPMAFTVAGILLPTLIHVSLFTLVFMTLGAVKSKSRAQFGLVALYLAAVVFIVVLPPPEKTVIPAFGGLAEAYFGDVIPALGAVIGLPGIHFDARFAGLLSFVYTYHYLNWFIKADVIKWNAIPRARMAGIAGLSLLSAAVYLYDYAVGFMVLLALSLMHVLLEFPLNAVSVRQLAGSFAPKPVTVKRKRKAA